MTESDLEQESDDLSKDAGSGIMRTLTSLETKVVHMTRSATARLDLFKPAPPKLVSMAEDQVRSRDELLSELRLVRQQLITTHQALGFAIRQLSASNAHCTSIHRELSNVREQLNNATKTRERGSKKVKACFVTSKALCLEFEQEEAEREEHGRVAAEKEKRKEAEDAENTRQIAEDALNRDFTGRMAGYKKCDLRALAVALSISDKGTNSELLTRIQNTFEENPDLKQNSQFSGLFDKSIHGRKGLASNEDVDTKDQNGPGDRLGGTVDLDTACIALPHSSHPPNMMASSSSHDNHYFYQYHIPSFGMHPQSTNDSSTNHIAYNFDATQHHTYYDNLLH